MIKELTKAELDLLSRDQIYAHRTKYIISANPNIPWANSEGQRYINELELYLNIRFKQDALDRFQNYRTHRDPEIKGIFSIIDDQSMYEIQFKLFLQKYGLPKYILGLNFPIPLGDYAEAE